MMELVSVWAQPNYISKLTARPTVVAVLWLSAAAPQLTAIR
jgi:hypothetical protein